MREPMYYHRDGTAIVSTDPDDPLGTLEWAKMFEGADRNVAQTRTIYGERLSTVFLGLDHSYGDGPPLIFETMLFAPMSRQLREAKCARIRHIAESLYKIEAIEEMETYAEEERIKKLYPHDLLQMRYSTEAEALAAHPSTQAPVSYSAALEKVFALHHWEGFNMELNEAMVNELLDCFLETAKLVREGIPYGKTDAMTPIIAFIGPNCESSIAPANWRDEPQKYAMMRAVSHVAQEMLCQAVIMVSDVRWVSSEKAEKMLGLPSIKEIGVEEWGKLYRRELATRYKGYLGNAPAELYSEAVIVVMKGPRLKGIPTRIAHYEKGENDSIRWLEMKNMYETTAQFNLLPDWWC